MPACGLAPGRSHPLEPSAVAANLTPDYPEFTVLNARAGLLARTELAVRLAGALEYAFLTVIDNDDATGHDMGYDSFENSTDRLIKIDVNKCERNRRELRIVDFSRISIDDLHTQETVDAHGVFETVTGGAAERLVEHPCITALSCLDGDIALGEPRERVDNYISPLNSGGVEPAVQPYSCVTVCTPNLYRRSRR